MNLNDPMWKNKPVVLMYKNGNKRELVHNDTKKYDNFFFSW